MNWVTVGVAWVVVIVAGIAADIVADIELDIGLDIEPGTVDMQGVVEHRRVDTGGAHMAVDRVLSYTRGFSLQP